MAGGKDVVARLPERQVHVQRQPGEAGRAGGRADGAGVCVCVCACVCACVCVCNIK